MSKKDRAAKRKAEKLSREPQYRSLEERRSEVRTILMKLTELNLTVQHDEIRKLMELMKTYVGEGVRTEISIPFPSTGRTISGVLAINKREECVVLMRKN